MLEFKLKDRTLKLPERLTLNQLKGILKWNIEDENNWSKIISIVLDYDLTLTKEQQEVVISFIVVMLNMEKETTIKLNELTFGEFVDMEVYLTNYIQNIDKIVLILNPDIKWADEAIYVINKWKVWREWLFKQYKGLFSNDNDGDDTNHSPTKSHLQVAKNWYKIIVELSGDDILKIDAITDQPLIKTLNFMAYQKEKALILQMETRKRNKQNEISRNHK